MARLLACAVWVLLAACPEAPPAAPGGEPTFGDKICLSYIPPAGEDAQALAKRPVFARNPSLLDDVKITYYGWLREKPEDQAYGAALMRLFPKELAKERLLLAELANVIEAFPKRPEGEDLEIIYEKMLDPLEQQWPSILQDARGRLG